MKEQEKSNGVVKKNAQGFDYKYADLAQITEHLADLGLRYIQSTRIIDGRTFIETTRIIKGEMEEKPLLGMEVVLNPPPKIEEGETEAEKSKIRKRRRAYNRTQELGKANTYARRNSVLMAFGLATEDDDAQVSNYDEPKEEPTPKRQPKPKEKPKEKAQDKEQEGAQKLSQSLMFDGIEAEIAKEAIIAYLKTNSLQLKDLNGLDLETFGKIKNELKEIINEAKEKKE